MRVIAGKYKSRKLIAPDGKRVRPTSDRAKETLFNMLEARMDFSGITCLDLFCGSGALGIECLSRGAGKCIFVDMNTELVKKNISLLGIGKNSDVVKSEVLIYLNESKLFNSNTGLVLCDPPYDFEKYNELAESISKLNALAVIEHSGRINFNENSGSSIFAAKKVGTVNFTFFNFIKN